MPTEIKIKNNDQMKFLIELSTYYCIYDCPVFLILFNKFYTFHIKIQSTITIKRVVVKYYTFLFY